MHYKDDWAIRQHLFRIFSNYLIMMKLLRGVRFAVGSKGQMGEGRMLYNIPSNSPSNSFQYTINEEAPPDAKDFSLRGLNILPFDDTPDFNKIPKLQHGLNKLLDGRIYQGDMGFGSIPELRSDVIAQMN